MIRIDGKYDGCQKLKSASAIFFTTNQDFACVPRPP